MKLSLNSKLLLVFIVLVAIPFLSMGWVFTAMNENIKIFSKTDSIARRSYLTGELIFETEKLLKTTGDYLISGDAEKRDDFDKIISDILLIYKELDGHKGGIRWEQTTDKVRDGATRLSKLLVDIMYMDNPVGNMRAEKLMEKATKLSEVLINDISEFHHLTDEDRQVVGSDAQVILERNMLFLTILLISSVFILLCIFYYFKFAITTPIKRLAESVGYISKGNFDVNIDINTGDELEELADSLSEMAWAIKDREDKLKALLKVEDKMAQELIEIGKYQDEFLSNISHELKTPLTHIMGFSELLSSEAGGELTDANIKYATKIHDSGKSLLFLINEMLKYSLEEPNKNVLDFKEFNVTEILDNVVEDYKIDIIDKSLTVSKVIEEGVENITADWEMMIHVFTNLMGNAIKFSHINGKIIINVSNCNDKGSECVLVTIVDEAVVIREDDRERIFNPFEVIDRAGVYDFGGLGMGLAVTRRLIEFHGGRIWAEEASSGNKFLFTIPIQAKEIE